MDRVLHVRVERSVALVAFRGGRGDARALRCPRMRTRRTVDRSVADTPSSYQRGCESVGLVVIAKERMS